MAEEDPTAHLFSRREARAAGVPVRVLNGALGDVVRLRPDVYVHRQVWEGAPRPGRLALRVAAERKASGVDLVAVAETAAQLHRLPTLRAKDDRIVLLERKQVRPLHHGGSAGLPEEHIEVVRGVPVTTLARTSMDVARRRGFAAGLIVADAALARGADFDPVLAYCRGWVGWRAARRVADEADLLAESALESLGRAGFIEERLPRCRLQVVLGDDDGPIGRVDHYFEEFGTVVEGDGRLKYDGLADQAPGRPSLTLFEEKRREDRLREAGFQVVRYTWDEAWRGRRELARRIERAFARHRRAA